MKKAILMTVFAIVSLSTVSCEKKTSKETQNEKGHDHKEGEAHDHDSTGSPHSDADASGHDHKEGEKHEAAYKCTMDCEKGKTYDKKGNCPVCKMDLIEAKADNHEGHDHSKENHDGHNHSEEGSEKSHEGHDH